MSERSGYDPWTFKGTREEYERNERRLAFEIIMADVDRGDLTREQAVAILSLSDSVLDIEYDADQLALFELQGGDD